jgi:colicin import membrane protein
MKKLITVLALISISGATRSQPADTPVGAASLMAMDGDRGRFQIERMRIESRFEKENTACYARFAVTDCLSQVRRHRREELDILRRQEIALNDAERQRKALEPQVRHFLNVSL